jgi:hypothetical protein
VSDKRPELDDLLQAALDNSGEEAQSEHLEQLLQQNPQLRAEFTAYEKLVASLNDLPELDPPAELLAATLSALGPAQSRTRSTMPRRAWTLNWLLGPPLRYGMAFLLGVGVTTGILGTTDLTSSTDHIELSGMMAPPETRLIMLREHGFEGSLTVMESDTQLQLQFQINAGAPTQLAVLYSSQAYQLSRLSRIAGDAVTLSYTSGRLELQVNGEQHFSLEFDAQGSETQLMELRYMAADGAVKHLNIVAPNED